MLLACVFGFFGGFVPFSAGPKVFRPNFPHLICPNKCFPKNFAILFAWHNVITKPPAKRFGIPRHTSYAVSLCIPFKFFDKLKIKVIHGLEGLNLRKVFFTFLFGSIKGIDFGFMPKNTFLFVVFVASDKFLRCCKNYFIQPLIWQRRKSAFAINSSYPMQFRHNIHGLGV